MGALLKEVSLDVANGVLSATAASNTSTDSSSSSKINASASTSGDSNTSSNECTTFAMMNKLVNQLLSASDTSSIDIEDDANSKKKKEKLSAAAVSSAAYPTVAAADFRVGKSDTQEHLIDKKATEYLSDTLRIFREYCNINFTPIVVDSDGSCLPHAVSRCLFGREVLYDVIRTELVKELKTHADWYKSIFQQGMDEDTWNVHWNHILEEATPTHGLATERWLGPGEHILGLANALGRPILVLDTPDRMARDDHASGLYLPLRYKTREEFMNAHGSTGTVPSPIVIGWANPNHSHFISLIRAEPDNNVEACATIFPKAWQQVRDIIYGNGNSEANSKLYPFVVPQGKYAGDICVLIDKQTNEEIIVRVPKGKQAGDKCEAKRERFGSPIEDACARILACNGETTRKRGCQMIHLMCSNLIDALTSADGDKINKTSKLKIENGTVKSSLLPLSGARELLNEVGFKLDLDLQGSSKPVPVIQFDSSLLNNSRAGEKLILVRDVLVILMKENGCLPGEGEVIAGKEEYVFGSRGPCLANFSWEVARDIYGHNGIEFSVMKADKGSRKTNGAWAFGSGRGFFRQENEKVSKELKKKLREKYEEVLNNSSCVGVGFKWDDPIEYHHRLTALHCQKCDAEQEWTGPIEGPLALKHHQACLKCNSTLSADKTGLAQISRYVYDHCCQSEFKYLKISSS